MKTFINQLLQKVFDPLEEVTRGAKPRENRLISELYMESRRSDSTIKPTCHVKRALIEAYYQNYQD
jgi:hypothetical protein